MHKRKQRVKSVIKEYKEELKHLGINVKQVILYGSFAKGSQRADSDIDLLIVSDDFKKLNLRQRLEILGIAAARIREPVEAKGYSFSEIEAVSDGSFLREILETGINS